MNREQIRVEIVTPVHNRRDITLQCLRSLLRIKKADLDVHIIIVDDGSSDGTSEAIRKNFPDVEIVQGDGNLWFTEGTNVGVRAALKHNPDYVLMMNDDQVFDEKFLEYMVGTAEKHPRSIVGSLLLLWDMPHKLFQVAPVWHTWKGGWQLWEEQTIWTIPRKTWEVEIIVGNCVLVPVQAIREEGLMNSKRYPNFGDVEYTPRLRKKGWKLLIDPRARVFCQPNTIPPSFADLSLRKKIDAFIFNLGHTRNLRRQFYAYLDSAPTKIAGMIALTIFFGNLLKRKVIGSRQTDIKSEKKLADMFSEVAVKE
jgi:GT2 family glycosyltransferase